MFGILVIAFYLGAAGLAAFSAWRGTTRLKAGAVGAVLVSIYDFLL